MRQIGWSRQFVGVLLVVAGLITSCQSSVETAVSPILLDLPVSAPTMIVAGNQFSVTAGPADWLDGADATLVMTGSNGPRIFQTAVANGLATFTVSPADSQIAGHVSLLIRSDNYQGTDSLVIQPSEPVEPITPLVGARSIIADGDHWAMVVVVPFDRFGNPVAEETPVEVRVQHPGNRLEKEVVFVEHLLAWKRTWSGTKAGRSTVAATVAGQYGPEKELMEIPGWPVTFDLQVDPPTIVADGRQQLTLQTGMLTDEFDNVLPDGTLVTFTVYEDDDLTARRSLFTYTLDGIASVPLQSPATPTTFTIVGSILGVVSEPLTLSFEDGPAVGRFAVTSRIDSIAGEVILKAGPLLGSLAQYVPDGTAVVFLISQNGNEMATTVGEADAGYAIGRLRLALLSPGIYDVYVTVGSGSGIGRFTIAESSNE